MDTPSKIMGSIKGVICKNLDEIKEVEHWRLSQGFIPTPDFQLKFLYNNGGALGVEPAWSRYPVEGYEKDTVTFEKFKTLISGQPNFEVITSSICSLLEYKNAKYGNSALEPLQIFSGKTKLGTRLDDKLARIKNGTELRKNDVADCIGYLTLICAENGWDNFDELKD